MRKGIVFFAIIIGSLFIACSDDEGGGHSCASGFVHTTDQNVLIAARNHFGNYGSPYGGNYGGYSPYGNNYGGYGYDPYGGSYTNRNNHQMQEQLRRDCVPVSFRDQFYNGGYHRQGYPY